MGVPSAIVMLVHGTAAGQAAWTGEDGEIARALKTQFEGAVITVAPKWSGWNLHRARIAAAEQFRQQIREIAKCYPGVPLFIVAHSHGGTVAAYALRDPECERLVNGLALLATPFFRCVARPLSSLRLPTLVGIGTLTALVAFTLVYALLAAIGWRKPDYWDPLWSWDTFWTAVIGTAVASIYRRVVASVARKLVRAISRRGHRFRNDVRVILPKCIPVLAVYSRRDEASGYLRFWRVFERRVYRMLNWRIIPRFVSLYAASLVYKLIKISFLFWKGVDVIFSQALLGRAATMDFPEFEALVSDPSGAINQLAKWVGIVLALCTIVIVYATVLLAMQFAIWCASAWLYASPLSVGVSSFLASFWMDVDVASTPPSATNVQTHEAVLKGGLTQLRHVGIHNNAEVATYVAKWVESKLLAIADSNNLPPEGESLRAVAGS
jgi:hypothetical protein